MNKQPKPEPETEPKPEKSSDTKDTATQSYESLALDHAFDDYNIDIDANDDETEQANEQKNRIKEQLENTKKELENLGVQVDELKGLQKIANKVSKKAGIEQVMKKIHNNEDPSQQISNSISSLTSSLGPMLPNMKRQIEELETIIMGPAKGKREPTEEEENQMKEGMKRIIAQCSPSKIMPNGERIVSQRLSDTQSRLRKALEEKKKKAAENAQDKQKPSSSSSTLSNKQATRGRSLGTFGPSASSSSSEKPQKPVSASASAPKSAASDTSSSVSVEPTVTVAASTSLKKKKKNKKKQKKEEKLSDANFSK